MQVNNITKEEQLRGIISARISSGHYRENDKIDSIRDLANEFKVSKPTMGLVISNLVTQGILKTEQGRGTFVTSRSQRNVFTLLAGVLMATSGDLYGDMAEAVVQQLQTLGYHPLTIDIVMSRTAPDVFTDRLGELINSRPVGIIIDGGQQYEDGLDKFVSRFKGQNIGIIFRDKMRVDGKFTRVLTDDSVGWYLGTRHLLELGHRNILMMASSAFTDPGMRDGCRKAFAEFGIDWNYESRLLPGGSFAETKKIIHDRINSPQRPTAIFASQDNQAVMAYFAAMQIGLRVPEDLSLLGYYNTPWVEKIDVPLSSISVKEQLMGRTIVDRMFGRKNMKSVRSTTIIEPELIVRNSTTIPRG